MKSKYSQENRPKSFMFNNNNESNITYKENPVKESNSIYFVETDYRDYREEMIKKIDKDKITSSFVELRELGASLKSLILQPGNIEEILNGFENKSQIKKEKKEALKSNSNIKSSIISKQEEKTKKHSEIKEQLVKEKEKEEKDDLFEQFNEENLKKILGNLELYLSSNLKEIKDFRDAMGKHENFLQKNQSINKFPDESYENTPLASNIHNKKSSFLKKIANLQEDNVNLFINDLDKLTEEISLIENKANQMEIEKLISKIKVLTAKEEKNLQEIKNFENSSNKINENSEKVSFYSKIEVSDCFYDEEIDRSSNDYMMKFGYKDAILVIFEEIIAFFSTWEKEEPFFHFDHASISEIIEFFNNKPLTNIFFSEEKKEEKKRFSNDFNKNQFSGFQIKFLSESVLKALFLKCDTFPTFEKFDQIFCIFNLRRNLSLKPNEFLYKNQKFPIGFAHEEFAGLSQTTLPKMQSNLNLNFEGQINQLADCHNMSPIRKDKRSILNFENNANNQAVKKKKVTHFRLNENKSNTNIILESVKFDNKNEEYKKNYEQNKKIYDENKKNFEENHKTFDPDGNYQSLLEHFERAKKDSVMEMSASQGIAKQMDTFEKLWQSKIDKEMNDPSQKLVKAKKVLINGFVFLKYGKMGDPHERFICLNLEKNTLECRAFFNIKNKGKVFELKKLENVQFGRGGANFQRFNKGNMEKKVENYCFSLMFAGNKRLDLESECEWIKKSFLDNLEIYLDK